MAKRIITVEFYAEIHYSAEIEVTEEEFKKLEDNDGNDVRRYLRGGEGFDSNPAFEILEEYAVERNELGCADEFTNFEILLS